MSTKAEIREKIRSFILESYMAGLDPSGLKDDVSLERSHIVDSARVLELILFLEETFGLEVTNDDATPENFDTVDAIVGFVAGKVGAAS
ncbi:MAG: acyl carrier protein [Myxococcales bacterium]|jgi:acyl carrier protein|nr:acyl carrier protein [Myxococcales bacterium]MBL9110303.1 acyl carrier protein [Myxococcales bacterium]